MKKIKFFLSIFTTAFCINSYATPAVGSREYKLMLDPSLFMGATPHIPVNNYWNALSPLIEGGEINRNTTGTFTLDKQRLIKFYDTPLTCKLNAKGYIFREREENGLREVTLKYRHYDRFIAGHKNMQGEAHRNPITKFEEDISTPFTAKYSHSTTQEIGATKNLNKMNDPVGLYSGLTAYNFNLNDPIELVSNLTITELVYKGTFVDLGNLNAKFSLTLWYDNNTSTSPLVAEISFKYKDKNENYSENVVNRAAQVFEAMQTMTAWTSTSSLTKTAFVFAYTSPHFCQ